MVTNTAAIHAIVVAGETRHIEDDFTAKQRLFRVTLPAEVANLAFPPINLPDTALSDMKLDYRADKFSQTRN